MIVVLTASAATLSQTAEQQRPIVDPDTLFFTTLEQEKPILDEFARLLQLESEAKGYIIVYGGRVSCRGEARQILGLVKNYLGNGRKINEERIVSIDGGYRERTTYEVWRVPPGIVGPKAAPTVDPRGVKFRRRNHPACNRLRASATKQRRA